MLQSRLGKMYRWLDYGDLHAQNSSDCLVSMKPFGQWACIKIVVIKQRPRIHIVFRIAGFILGRVYGMYSPVCPSDDKFLPLCLLILIKLPDARKCTPTKKNLKIELCALLKLLSQQTDCTICELWQLSKNQKWKQSSDWYSQDDRTPIQYVAPFQ